MLLDGQRAFCASGSVSSCSTHINNFHAILRYAQSLSCFMSFPDRLSEGLAASLHTSSRTVPLMCFLPPFQVRSRRPLGARRTSLDPLAQRFKLLSMHSAAISGSAVVLSRFPFPCHCSGRCVEEPKHVSCFCGCNPWKCARTPHSCAHIDGRVILHLSVQVGLKKRR